MSTYRPLLTSTERVGVVVVPCGARKRHCPPGAQVPAGELYCGSYHLAARRAADALTKNGRDGRTLILSARWGLLDLHEPITSYDLKAGEDGTISGDRLHRQAAALGVTDARVTVLGGRTYVELARTVWPDLHAPLEGSRGIGDHMSRFATMCEVQQALDAMERSAAARRTDQAERIARKHARYVSAQLLRIDQHQRAEGRLDFPGSLDKAEARARAARRFAYAFGVDTRTLRVARRSAAVYGPANAVARFLSALPAILAAVENLATLAALLYGRWERHSNAVHHLALLDAPTRSMLARRFRAASFEVVVDTILFPPPSVPEADTAVPVWEQAELLAGGIAHYYRFPLSEMVDPAKAAELLAHADRV